MKISYQWLQTYFDEKLPEPAVLADGLTMRAFEVENFEGVGDDVVFDIAILPNRAHDCLSHIGVAKEIAALFSLKLSAKKLAQEKDIFGMAEFSHEEKTNGNIKISIQNSTICGRYIGRLIEHVKVAQSAEWLRERLSAIGQRSINNIVDITNFVMFETGQPMHAFDADKIEGGEIIVRNANFDEKIVTLDGKDVNLGEDTLVVADLHSPLAIAGVKGGKKGEVTEATTRIILEAANFSGAAIRRASQKLGIRTDSSKRFENEIALDLAWRGMNLATELIAKEAGGPNISIYKAIDLYYKQPEYAEISVSCNSVRKILGIDIAEEEIAKILGMLGFIFTKKDGGRFMVEVPAERLDLRIMEDILEEIGRIYGYEKIPSQELLALDLPKVNVEFYYTDKVRNILRDAGFSEVYTYSFFENGNVEMENPISADKKFLRGDLISGFSKALDSNLYYADLFMVDQIKIFEIGRVFGSNVESVHIAIGIAEKKQGKKSAIHPLDAILDRLERELGVEIHREHNGRIWEANFSELIKMLPTPDSYGHVLGIDVQKNAKYKRISPYPFIVRDIALFVPESVKPEEIAGLLTDNAGELLIHTPKLFDQFQKLGSERVSYAFRLIFQSYEKTLTDEDVNIIIVQLTELLNAKEGWQVR